MLLPTTEFLTLIHKVIDDEFPIKKGSHLHEVDNIILSFHVSEWQNLSAKRRLAFSFIVESTLRRNEVMSNAMKQKSQKRNYTKDNLMAQTISLYKCLNVASNIYIGVERAAKNRFLTDKVEDMVQMCRIGSPVKI